jgi:phosphoenolpyruvate carboxykinase (ATP)
MTPGTIPSLDDSLSGPVSKYGLELYGIDQIGREHWNLSTSAYYRQSILREEAYLSNHGALVVHSGPHTARSANDKFIVQEPDSSSDIDWGEYNIGYRQEDFNRVFDKMKSYLRDKDVFIQDGTAGVPEHQELRIRVISTWAWQGLFTRNMFHTPTTNTEFKTHQPEFTVISLPEFPGDPELDHLNSSTFILIDFSQHLVLIGNTGYGGEIKKSIFTALNYYLPKKNILTMHCSANVGPKGDSALFFGLSGTGKTTLSADPERKLIGDDEHGWDKHGVFNFEDGSYAKVIDLSPEHEPDIHHCTQSFGTILENVVGDPPSGSMDLYNAKLTRNTRASYPLDCIPYSLPSRQGGHPENIVFLTFDANGVMPPLAKLNPSQALYHFISGYTSKVGGTEAGVGESPEITFSACFGAPFMVFHPAYYAELLKARIQEHGANTWLINTGLVGGGSGVGKRISIKHTRSLLTAALTGELNNQEFRLDPVFQFEIPLHCPGVPDEILKPEELWDDREAYFNSYRNLARSFQNNFKKYESQASADVIHAGPVIKNNN